MLDPKVARRILDRLQSSHVGLASSLPGVGGSAPPQVILVRAGTRSQERVTKAIQAGLDTVQLDVKDADSMKIYAPMVRRFNYESTRWAHPPEQPSVLAEAVSKNVKEARDAVRDELSTAKWSFAGVTALAGVTAVAAAGAAVFSNIVGVATTAIAGGSGTAGLGASLKSSVISYRTLKSQSNARVRKMQADLNVALGPPEDPQKLEDVQKQVDAFHDWVASQAGSAL